MKPQKRGKQQEYDKHDQTWRCSQFLHANIYLQSNHWLRYHRLVPSCVDSGLTSCSHQSTCAQQCQKGTLCSRHVSKHTIGSLFLAILRKPNKYPSTNLTTVRSFMFIFFNVLVKAMGTEHSQKVQNPILPGVQWMCSSQGVMSIEQCRNLVFWLWADSCFFLFISLWILCLIFSIRQVTTGMPLSRTRAVAKEAVAW